MEKNYFKLLNYKQKLEEMGDKLSLEEEKKLLNYQNQILDYFRWEKRTQFIEAMVDFLENKIDLDQYINRFHEIDFQVLESKKKLTSDFENLRAFEPDPSSKSFAILIENLFSDIRILEPDDELRSEDEISEKSLRDGIKEFLPKIQNYS